MLTYTNAEDEWEIPDLTAELVTTILVNESFAVYVIPLSLSSYLGDGQSSRAA
ncbi:MAG: hypothetical protein M1370_09810 [Bacteroidetes bacterium]|nr:hypothetical protein [Bacteroidota bacterium]MCL5025123.1 hypothetical protein [Chloroflexota bacterium]